MRSFVESPWFRLIFVIPFIIAEIVLTYLLLDYTFAQFAWVNTILHIVSIIIVLAIVRLSRHLSSDLIWILFILIAPIAGTTFYLLASANMITGRTYRGLVNEAKIAAKYYEQDESVMKEVEETAHDAAGHFRYLLEDGGFPTYRNADATYYPLGDYAHAPMLEDLRKAERFIFFEYFIIEEGKMWDPILEILVQKAEQGVDVRVLYDDMGSIGTLPARYAGDLEKRGVKCISFNRLNPIIGAIVNHRDHRKILVIDGKVAYTGGINLADEYINAVVKFGHWKDNAIRVTGKAVWSFTTMFLTTWNALRHEDDDYRAFYLPSEAEETHGFIAPYGETPLDDKNVGQNVYLNIIDQAHDYCYITTPYLIIDTEMENALIRAAQRGVDVRIITPGIPDKHTIFAITRSYYAPLIKGGVHILAYDPGFVHAKVFVSDDTIATVGTLNLDYRSLYLHFENGVLMYRTSAVEHVRDDVVETFKKCHEVTTEECTKGVVQEGILSVARVFAPLL